MKYLNDTHLDTQNGSQTPLRKPQGNIEHRVAGCKDGRISRHITNTKIVSPCPNCSCITFDLMDEEGNRYCGKCKERK